MRRTAVRWLQCPPEVGRQTARMSTGGWAPRRQRWHPRPVDNSGMLNIEASDGLIMSGEVLMVDKASEEDDASDEVDDLE